MRQGGVDHLERNLSLEGIVTFLKSQPGAFRVETQASPPSNLGDLFGIPGAGGGGVFLPAASAAIMANRDLLNVRYLLKPASAPEPGAVYQDAAWKLCENPRAFPRAWLVHDILMHAPDNAYDPSRTVLVVGDSGSSSIRRPARMRSRSPRLRRTTWHWRYMRAHAGCWC